MADTIAETRNPYVFVVGCPRSGTTLLQRMLDSHPDLSVANDTHFIPRIVENSRENNPRLTPELIERILTYHRFTRLQFQHDRVKELATGLERYTDLIRALYTEYARVRGKSWGGEKTPDYVKHLLMLHEMFPGAKYVHIIRDGRNTTLSILQWAAAGKGPAKSRLWNEEPLAVSALWWRSLVSKGLQDGAILGSDYYQEVRYEELVESPSDQLRRTSAFLNLPFSERMLTYYEGKTRGDDGLSAKEAWLPPTPNLRDWKIQMSTRAVELFEALAGDLLSSLGYETAFKTISPGVRALANNYERLWLAELEYKKAKRLTNRSLKQ